jgi:hypothetical protein
MSLEIFPTKTTRTAQYLNQGQHQHSPLKSEDLRCHCGKDLMIAAFGPQRQRNGKAERKDGDERKLDHGPVDVVKRKDGHDQHDHRNRR